MGRFDETIILNEGASFMTVRHQLLDGSNREIGSALAGIARSRHGLSKTALSLNPPTVNLESRRYFEKHYPILIERSRGVADVLDVEPDDERFDCTAIPYNQSMPASAGCSTVYFPSSKTRSGHSCISRNFDFPKCTLPEMMGMELSESDYRHMRPLMADPYIIEMHPSDGGYSSIAMHSFELLSGVLDGMNSRGLMVVLHGNEIAIGSGQYEPESQGIGLFELQSMRLILDTCATAGEARDTLLANRHYFVMMPCIYLVADRNGNSFVFEPGLGGSEPRVTDTKNVPFVLTNHPLSSYPSIDAFSEKSSMLDSGTSSFERYRELACLLRESAAPYSVDDMKRINSSVAVSRIISHLPGNARASVAASKGLGRTLWHALYDALDLTLNIKFYTGEKALAAGGFEEKYSDYFKFTLKP